MAQFHDPRMPYEDRVRGTSPPRAQPDETSRRQWKIWLPSLIRQRSGAFKGVHQAGPTRLLNCAEPP